MTSPVSGWYPDPSGQPGERWWNGVSWSDHTRPVPAPTAAPATPADAAVPVDAPQAWDGFGNPVAPRPAVPTPIPGVPLRGAPPYGASPYGTPPFGGSASTPPHGAAPHGGSQPPFASQPYAGSPGPRPSFVSRNGFSFGTIGVAVGYLLILVFAHFAILGILPLFLGFRAVGRKEPLAWLAVVVGVVALVFGIYEFAR